MKKLLYMAVLVGFLLLPSCNSPKVITTEFAGESEYWKASLIQSYNEKFYKDNEKKLNYENSGTEEISLQYKGENANKIKNIKLELTSPVAGNFKFDDIITNGKLKVVKKFKNRRITGKDEKYVMEIKWNNATEKIELISK